MPAQIGSDFEQMKTGRGKNSGNVIALPGTDFENRYARRRQAFADPHR
jgi:hypothetical protein